MRLRSAAAPFLAFVAALGLLSACSSAAPASPTAAPKPAAQQPAAAGQKAPTYTFRIGHGSATSHPYQVGAEMFAEAVSKASNGDIKVNIFPNGTAGDDLAMMQQAQIGGLDIATNSTAVFNSVPSIAAFQLPFLIPSYEAAGKIYSSDAAMKLLEDVTPMGLKPLAVWEGGFRHFLSTKAAVQSPADLKGLKVRVAQSQLNMDIFNALGASPVPIAYGEVYTALQTKTVDAVEINISSVYGLKYDEVAKYFTYTGHYMWPAIVSFSKVKWDTLPPNVQKILADSARQVTAAQVAKAASDDEAQAAQLKAKGVQFTTVSNIQPFKDLVKPVYDKYEGLAPSIKPFVDAANALAK